MTHQEVQGFLHHVFGVFVVLAAICGSGHANVTTEDGFLLNTTSLSYNGSRGEQQVLAVQKPCGSEHEGYCVNGACSYISDLDTPVCWCKKMYTGVRCEHMILDTQGASSTEKIIGITCGIILLLGALNGVILFCCLYKRCRKTSPLYKDCSFENSV